MASLKKITQRDEDLRMDFSRQKVKLLHARKRAADLDEIIDSWRDKEPWDTKTVIDNNRLGLTVRLIVKQEPPYHELEMLISEIVGALRSLLDNTVMVITKSSSKQPKNIKTVHFPICATKREWNEEKKRVSHLPLKYRSRIEKIQPFNRIHPETDPLLLLRELDNKNKHYVQVEASLAHGRASHEVTLEMEDTNARESYPANVEVKVTPFKDGEILMRMNSGRRIAKIEGKYNISGIVVIKGEKTIYPLDVLGIIGGQTERVFNYLTTGSEN